MRTLRTATGKCADEQVAFGPGPEILDQPSPVDDESDGYDPYNKGVLQNKPSAE